MLHLWVGIKLAGWIKLHRKMTEWEWYKKPGMLQLMVHLVLKANHQDASWQGITIRRGQLVTGRKSLSQETGLSEQVIRTCLNKLKSTNEITIKSTNKYSIITICNYNKYQDLDTENNQSLNHDFNQQLTSNQPATNQQLTTNKNEKNEKNEKKDQTPLSENEPLSDLSHSVSPEEDLPELIPQVEPAVKPTKPKAESSHTGDQDVNATKRSKPNAENYTPEFQAFWDFYRENFHNTPAGDKKPAFAEYKKLIKQGVSNEEVMRHTRSYLADCKRTDTNSKHAQRFLKNHDFRENVIDLAKKKPSWIDKANAEIAAGRL